MTRVAIIGSSHVGALRQADAQVRARYPQIELAYFAMPNGIHAEAGMDSGGRITCEGLGAEDADLLRQINGTTDFDTAGFDVIWHVGPPLGLEAILWFFARHRLYGDKDSRDRPLISWRFANAAMGDLMASQLESIVRRYNGDTRIVLTPAPYPAQMATLEGPRHEWPLLRMSNRAYAPRVVAHFEGLVEACTDAIGWQCLLQPAVTRAGPFLTRDKYLRDLPDRAADARDLRHMNARYGATLFDAFMRDILGETPREIPTAASIDAAAAQT